MNLRVPSISLADHAAGPVLADEILKDSWLVLYIFSPGTYLLPLGVSVTYRTVLSPSLGNNLGDGSPALFAGQQGKWFSRQEECCVSADWHCFQEIGGLHFG